MNEELIAIFDLMERERGIQRDTIIKAIERAAPAPRISDPQSRRGT